MRKIAWVLIIALSLSLVACGQGPIASQQISSQGEMNTEKIDDTDVFTEVDPDVLVTDFAAKLFQQKMTETPDGKNILLSPISVYVALAMLANGAEGETQDELCSLMGYSPEQLAVYVHNYMTTLPSAEDYKLSMANSVWFTEHERFTVNEEFLSINRTYFGADIFKAPFDGTTLNDINRWVEEKTDGMIKDVLKEIRPDAVMYLVNALAFDAKWADTYDKGQIRKGQFTKEDGSVASTDMMYSEEFLYLEDENTIGFMKEYKGGKYAFVALLPEEGTSMKDYVASLSGEKIRNLLDTLETTPIDAAMPKFQTEDDTLLNDTLRAMGVELAFDAEKADLSGAGTSTAGNVFVNQIIHKTFIEVGPLGTRAGAATVIEIVDESVAIRPDPKKVILDRPFVYMIIDCENQQPIFIGTLMEP